MSNYIIIPITDDTDRPLLTGSFDPTGWTASGAFAGGGGTSATIPITTDGDGSGATGTVEVDATGPPNAITGIGIVAGGENYAVGDTITITVPNSDGINGSGGDIDVSATITEGMLKAVSSEAQENIPIDNVVGVMPNSGGDVLVVTNEWDGASVGAWSLSIDLDDSATQPSAVTAVSEAFRKASQAENSQPLVEFPGGVSCFNVTYAT